jgi:hypothetical protein
MLHMCVYMHSRFVENHRSVTICGALSLGLKIKAGVRTCESSLASNTSLSRTRERDQGALISNGVMYLRGFWNVNVAVGSMRQCI